MKGLTAAEVQERIQAGQVNVNDHPVTRTYKRIFLDNILTFFNFLNIALFVMVILVGSYKNSLFIMTIVFNTTIGIVQEIRAKKVIDKLAIMTQNTAIVVRDEKKWTIATDKLVVDDVILLKNGDQVPADCEMLEGSLEVNESLLTGEADNLTKMPGDELFSGSFVTSGEGYCRITRVGSDSYASKITSEAKEFRRHNSELRNSLNFILKVISIIIVPIGALLFYKQHYIIEDTFRDSVVSTVAAVLGMIPEGLILLTSVTLTIGAVRLAMRKTLVQELYCIETLAKVDTLCLDKTGTITEGTMKVEKILPYDENLLRLHTSCATQGELPALEDLMGPAAAYGPGSAHSFVMNPGEDPADPTGTPVEAVNVEKIEEGSDDDPRIRDIVKIMGNIMAVSRDRNATAEALKARFPVRRDYGPGYAVDFSSDRKYSGASFESAGTYLIGAGQFLFPDGYENLKEFTTNYADDGLRVLILAHSDEVIDSPRLPSDLRPVGLILITDVIREEAPRTMEYFLEQGVNLKVISGDDPATVSAIAKRAGVPNAWAYIDATTITTPEQMKEAIENYSVFGRVTPQQKKEMVLALKEAGHTVAMTGDGVNDVLALKESDCSIAMAAGSSAAKNIANIVLLDSNFASMPHIVNQGRRVVNNIRTAASMFLIKTMFSVMLSLITIFWGDMYPFEPIQMSLISACAVGIPTFFLSQEDNYNKVDHTFLRHVFMNAFPAAMTITGCVFTVMLVSQNVYHSTAMLGTACFLVTGWNYMAALKTVYAPMNRFRTFIIYSMQLVFFAAAVIAQNLLSLKALEFGMIILVFVLMTFSPLLITIITEWIRKTYEVALDTPEKKWYHIILEKLWKP
ncbi:MAG: HAD-IC family P-type ATPase [Blautia sp.]|nr:HAD-IC family P-type ATPase [Blautia sp.]